jgi:hypothetical protein
MPGGGGALPEVEVDKNCGAGEDAGQSRTDRLLVPAAVSYIKRMESGTTKINEHAHDLFRAGSREFAVHAVLSV